MRFGEWEIIGEPIKKGKRKYWHCRCTCGNHSVICDYDLKSGKSTKCRTCANREPNSELGRKFSHIPKEVLAKVRSAAQNAMLRCNDPKHKRFNDWGGRGIKVCFSDKQSFTEYLLSLPGYDDLSLVIDRINNDGNYEAGNLRWVSRSLSQINQRDNGGEHAYCMNNGFAKRFKYLHDLSISFEKIGNLYCVNPSTIRNCVRELEYS